MQFSQAAILYTRADAGTALNAQGAPVQHVLNLHLAKTAWSRFRGLMLAPALKTEPQTQGLLITRCPSVHGCFMRQAIDVVYLAAADESAACTGPGLGSHTVTHTATLNPWGMSFGKSHVVVTPQGKRTLRSAHALELPAGSIQRLHISVGDTVEMTP